MNSNQKMSKVGKILDFFQPKIALKLVKNVVNQKVHYQPWIHEAKFLVMSQKKL